MLKAKRIDTIKVNIFEGEGRKRSDAEKQFGGSEWETEADDSQEGRSRKIVLLNADKITRVQRKDKGL